MTEPKTKPKYNPFCCSCRVTQSQMKETSKKVRLKGGWLLCHNDGGYLGRLVLQTEGHISHFNELDQAHEQWLGKHLKAIDQVMRDNWREWFAEELAHLYVVSFSEAPGWHLHLHLFARPKSFESFDNWEHYRAWGIHDIQNASQFPDLYKFDKDRADALVLALRDSLPADCLVREC
jgi:hypothetical protein